MRKAALIATAVLMMLSLVACGVKKPEGTYKCNDEFFGYKITFVDDNVRAGKSSRGTFTMDEPYVTVSYIDGTTETFIYYPDDDYLTDSQGVLTWEKID